MHDVIISYAFSYFFISDIDECAKDIDSCDQICTNTPGSYNCSCQKGFKLSRDALNCQGNPVLFILVTIIHACWKKKKKKKKKNMQPKEKCQLSQSGNILCKDNISKGTAFLHQDFM